MQKSGISKTREGDRQHGDGRAMRQQRYETMCGYGELANKGENRLAKNRWRYGDGKNDEEGEKKVGNGVSVRVELHVE
jgi:hypothetical protein